MPVSEQDRLTGFAALPGRGLVRVSGPDAAPFLDALVSNDLALLDAQPAVYACLLTPQGKFQFDFIVRRDGDGIILDCEGGERAEALGRRLALYRLRSRIDIAVAAEAPVYAAGAALPGFYPDPRHPALGYRGGMRPDGLEDRGFAAWDMLRIRSRVPDGSRDMVPGQSTLIECGIDRLNGVSFAKGCYIGQELTARMHHRGLAKKHLYAVEWREAPPPPGTDIAVNGMAAGQARSSCGRLGLVLLKDEAAESGNDLPFRMMT